MPVRTRIERYRPVVPLQVEDLIRRIPPPAFGRPPVQVIDGDRPYLLVETPQRAIIMNKRINPREWAEPEIRAFRDCLPELQRYWSHGGRKDGGVLWVGRACRPGE